VAGHMTVWPRQNQHLKYFGSTNVAVNSAQNNSHNVSVNSAQNNSHNVSVNSAQNNSHNVAVNSAQNNSHNVAVNSAQNNSHNVSTVFAVRMCEGRESMKIEQTLKSRSCHFCP
jgi:hypothetical protein